MIVDVNLMMPRRKDVMGVVIVVERQADLLEIVKARHTLGLLPDPLKRGHKYRQKQSNDGDHYQ